jgi:hypothetical protein
MRSVFATRAGWSRGGEGSFGPLEFELEEQQRSWRLGAGVCSASSHDSPNVAAATAERAERVADLALGMAARV